MSALTLPLMKPHLVLGSTPPAPLPTALHACFGIGSVVSPVMVGFLDYRPSFLILAAISTLPALGVVIQDYLPRAKIMGSPSPAIALSPSSTTGDSVAREEDKSLGPMPLAVRVLVCCFFFVYVGCEVSERALGMPGRSDSGMPA